MVGYDLIIRCDHNQAPDHIYTITARLILKNIELNRKGALTRKRKLANPSSSSTLPRSLHLVRSLPTFVALSSPPHSSPSPLSPSVARLLLTIHYVPVSAQYTIQNYRYTFANIGSDTVFLRKRERERES